MKLEVHNLTHTFHNGTQPSVLALQNVSLTVTRGEIVSIVGPSGCGKTTLLECIAGLLTTYEGMIQIDGALLQGSCGHAAYMTQADVMLPWRSVLGNVMLPLEIAGIPASTAHAQGVHLLQQFSLDHFAPFSPAQLSGGMRQRVALLRAYAAHKDLLLLDEPFAKLDALTRREIQAWFLQSWEERKPAVLFVTHDVDEALFLADRVLVLSSRPGRIVKEFTRDLPRPRAPAPNASPYTSQIKIELLALLGAN